MVVPTYAVSYEPFCPAEMQFILAHRIPAYRVPFRHFLIVDFRLFSYISVQKKKKSTIFLLLRFFARYLLLQSYRFFCTTYFHAI